MTIINQVKNHGRYFYSGISGLQLPVPQYLFPEPYRGASRLTYYSSLFNSIEINSSFYKIPQGKTVGRWEEAVNDHFRFSFKLYKEITHSKGFDFSGETVKEFFAAISNIKNRKGCILIQLPPSLGCVYLAQLTRLLTVVNFFNTEKWNLAVEFRNKSWYNDEAYSVLNEFNSTLVIQDIPKSATPMTQFESDVVYLRFHGPEGNYRGSYAEEVLRDYASYIKEKMETGKTVYAYFNNTMGDAISNLNYLNSCMQEQPYPQQQVHGHF